MNRIKNKILIFLTLCGIQNASLYASSAHRLEVAPIEQHVQPKVMELEAPAEAQAAKEAAEAQAAKKAAKAAGHTPAVEAAKAAGHTSVVEADSAPVRISGKNKKLVDSVDKMIEGRRFSDKPLAFVPFKSQKGSKDLFKGKYAGDFYFETNTIPPLYCFVSKEIIQSLNKDQKDIRPSDLLQKDGENVINLFSHIDCPESLFSRYSMPDGSTILQLYDGNGNTKEVYSITGKKGNYMQRLLKKMPTDIPALVPPSKKVSPHSDPANSAPSNGPANTGVNSGFDGADSATPDEINGETPSGIVVPRKVSLKPVQGLQLQGEAEWAQQPMIPRSKILLSPSDLKLKKQGVTPSGDSRVNDATSTRTLTPPAVTLTPDKAPENGGGNHPSGDSHVNDATSTRTLTPPAVTLTPDKAPENGGGTPPPTPENGGGTPPPTHSADTTTKPSETTKPGEKTIILSKIKYAFNSKMEHADILAKINTDFEALKLKLSEKDVEKISDSIYNALLFKGSASSLKAASDVFVELSVNHYGDVLNRALPNDVIIDLKEFQDFKEGLNKDRKSGGAKLILSKMYKRFIDFIASISTLTPPSELPTPKGPTSGATSSAAPRTPAASQDSSFPSTVTLTPPSELSTPKGPTSGATSSAAPESSAVPVASQDSSSPSIGIPTHPAENSTGTLPSGDSHVNDATSIGTPTSSSEHQTNPVASVTPAVPVASGVSSVSNSADTNSGDPTQQVVAASGVPLGGATSSAASSGAPAANSSDEISIRTELARNRETMEKIVPDRQAGYAADKAKKVARKAARKAKEVASNPNIDFESNALNEGVKKLSDAGDLVRFASRSPKHLEALTENKPGIDFEPDIRGVQQGQSRLPYPAAGPGNLANKNRVRKKSPLSKEVKALPASEASEAPAAAAPVVSDRPAVAAPVVPLGDVTSSAAPAPSVPSGVSAPSVRVDYSTSELAGSSDFSPFSQTAKPLVELPDASSALASDLLIAASDSKFPQSENVATNTSSSVSSVQSSLGSNTQVVSEPVALQSSAVPVASQDSSSSLVGPEKKKPLALRSTARLRTSEPAVLVASGVSSVSNSADTNSGHTTQQVVAVPAAATPVVSDRPAASGVTSSVRRAESENTLRGSVGAKTPIVSEAPRTPAAPIITAGNTFGIVSVGNAATDQINPVLPGIPFGGAADNVSLNSNRSLPVQITNRASSVGSVVAKSSIVSAAPAAPLGGATSSAAAAPVVTAPVAVTLRVENPSAATSSAQTSSVASGSQASPHQTSSAPANTRVVTEPVAPQASKTSAAVAPVVTAPVAATLRVENPSAATSSAQTPSVATEPVAQAPAAAAPTTPVASGVPLGGATSSAAPESFAASITPAAPTTPVAPQAPAPSVASEVSVAQSRSSNSKRGVESLVGNVLQDVDQVVRSIVHGLVDGVVEIAQGVGSALGITGKNEADRAEKNLLQAQHQLRQVTATRDRFNARYPGQKNDLLEENVKNAEKLVDKVKIIAESSKMVASNAIAQPLSTGLPFGSQPDRASAEIGGASSVSVAVPLHTIETGLKEPVLASSQTEHSKTGLVSQVVKIGESVVSGLENAVQNTETVVAKLFHQGQVKSAQKNGTNLKPSELRKTQKGVGSFKSSLVAVKHDDEEKSTAKAKVQELITSNNVDLIKAFTDLRNARSKQPKNVGALKAEIMRLLEEKGVVSRSDQSSSPLGVQDFNTLFSFAFDPLPQGNKSVEINPASQLVSKKVSAPGKEKSVDAAGEIAASRAQDQKLEELKQQQAVAAKASGSEGKQAVPLVQAEGGSQAPEEDLFAALTPENIQAMKTNVEQIISKLNPTNLLESLKLRSLNLFLKVCESRDLRSIEGAWSALPADQKEIINKDLLQAQNKQVAAKNRALDAQQAALAKADQDAKNAAYNAATPSQKLANRDWGPKYRAEILEAQKQVVAQALFGGNKNADLVALVDQVDQAKTAYNQVYVFKEQPSDDAPVGTAPRVLKPGEVPSVKKAGRLIEPNPDALKSAQNELLKAEIAVFAKFHDLIKSSLGEKYGAYATLGINETGLDGVKTPVDYTNAASIKDSIALNSKYQVLFGQKPPTKPASKAQAETPAQEQDSVEIVKLIDGVDVTTYAKMKKIGVVDQLISQKMKDDGIAQNVIDRLLLQQFDQPARVAQIATVQGAVIDGITNLALLPYLKKLKMGTLNQAVVVQMTQDGMSQADIETIQSLALQPIENIQATYDALEKSSAQPKSDIAQTDVALSPDDQKTVQTFLDADYAGVVKNSTSIMKKRMAVVAYKKLNEAQKNWLNANDAFDPAVLDLPAKVVEPQSDQVENNAEVGADSSIATKASGVAALANQDSLSVLPLQNAVASQSSSLVGSVSSLPVAPADVSGVDKFKELIRKEGLIGAAGKTSLALPSLFDAVKPSTQSKPRSALQTPGILQGDLGSDFNGAVFNDLISGRSRGLQPQQPQPPVQVGVQLQ